LEHSEAAFWLDYPILAKPKRWVYNGGQYEKMGEVARSGPFNFAACRDKWNEYHG
jgi:hypothetical protein